MNSISSDPVENFGNLFIDEDKNFRCSDPSLGEECIDGDVRCRNGYRYERGSGCIQARDASQYDLSGSFNCSDGYTLV